jgi:PilZ domain-containing protein
MSGKRALARHREVSFAPEMATGSVAERPTLLKPIRSKVKQAPSLINQPIRLDWDYILRHPRIQPMIRRIFSDQRKYERFSLNNVVAYLGRAHASRPYRIGDVSVGGFSVLSDEAWTPGTEMPMTLQREEWDGEESAETITVQAIVVRRASGRTGFSIALSAEESVAYEDDDGKLWPSKAEMEQFLMNLRKPKITRLPAPTYINERPLSFAERTQRLLELAKAHSVSTTSKLLYQLETSKFPATD